MNKRAYKQFRYWMEERQRIYLARQNGESYPWTRDKILQEYKFTNVYRQQDAVTRKWTNQLNNHADRLEVEVFRNLVTFRMFNHPETFEALGGWRRRRIDVDRARSILEDRQSRKIQVFTGAYIITNNGSTRPKIDLVLEAIDAMHRDASEIVREIKKANTIRDAVSILKEYPMVGGFIAYEMVTDLRWTSILYDATDKYTYANPGPGAIRGLNRIHGRLLSKKGSVEERISEMAELLNMLTEDPEVDTELLPELEMRDIEHSLCEFDKYMRVKLGEGRPRSKYTPPSKR